MKKLLSFFVVFLFISTSFANFGIEVPPKKASEIFIPINGTDKKISLTELSQISMNDLQILTGRKMNLVERIALKSAQKKLRNNINPDGSFSKKYAKKLRKMAEGGGGFQAGGFFLGLLLGLIGVLIAYLIKDDQKRNRVKWAWIGWAVWIGILLIIIAAGGVAYY